MKNDLKISLIILFSRFFPYSLLPAPLLKLNRKPASYLISDDSNSSPLPPPYTHFSRPLSLKQVHPLYHPHVRQTLL